MSSKLVTVPGTIVLLFDEFKTGHLGAPHGFLVCVRVFVFFFLLFSFLLLVPFDRSIDTNMTRLRLLST